MVSIVRATSAHEDFGQLVRLLDADLNARYGALQAEYDQYNTIDTIETVVLAYVERQAVGCGGVKAYDHETGEIKRMYVKPACRGMGIASQILQELERWVLEAGWARTLLETGRKQHEAIRFYQKNGYRQIANYGQYATQPNSVCFEKRLSSA